ncbi:MAG: flagellar assembly protein FliX [Alphaproteobacteria bacterium]
MIIHTLGHSQGPSAPRRTARNQKAFSLGQSPETAEIDSTQQAGFLSPIVSFVMTQDEELPLEQKRRQQGRSILNTLKTLQRDVMMDRPSPHTLHRLKQQLAEDLSVPTSPLLHDILQQIELRARVELAKYGL